MEQRIVWVDLAKVLGMACIFWAHCEEYFLGTSATRFFVPFYVNIFFLVSGYLFFGHHLTAGAFSARSALRGIFERLWWPMTLFSILLFIPKMLFHARSITFNDFLTEIFGGTAYWFLAALFLVQLFVVVWCACCRRWQKVGLYVWGGVGLAAYLYWQLPYNTFPYCYPSACLALFYFVVGGCLQEYEQLFERKMTPFIALCLLAVYIVLLDMWQMPIYGGAKVLFSLFVLPPLVYFTKRGKAHRWVTYVSRHSLVFCLFCGAFPAAFSGMAHRCGLPLHFWGLLLVWGLSFISAAVSAKVISRYAPGMLNLRMAFRF